MILGSLKALFSHQDFRAVVFNLGYAYPQGYAKTSYGVFKIEE
jgi:hypothetical protein